MNVHDSCTRVLVNHPVNCLFFCFRAIGVLIVTVWHYQPMRDQTGMICFSLPDLYPECVIILTGNHVLQGF